jgi:hypothetical protein
LAVSVAKNRVIKIYHCPYKKPQFLISWFLCLIASRMNMPFTTESIETSFGRIAYVEVGSGPVTDCDMHDNWPPDAFKPFVEMVKAGGLRDTLNAMPNDKMIYRSPQALGPAYPSFNEA